MRFPYLKLFARSFSANLGAALEYRGNFLLQVFGMALNNAAFLIFWALLLDRTGPLGGYTLPDIYFLWALGSGAFGLAHVLCGNVHFLGQTIQNGELDTYLLQPKNVLFQVVTSRTSLSAWGDLLFGLVLFGFLAQSPLHWLQFGLFLLTGACIFLGVFILAESLTFYLGSSGFLSRALKDTLIALTLYPETIYPQHVRWALYSLIPGAWLAFLPLSLFKNFDPWLALAVLGAALTYLALGILVFHRGLKRYESGNLMSTRV